MLPVRLAATVESYKAEADAFPWQRIKDQRRTVVSILRIRITVDDVGDGLCDIAGLDYSNRLLCVAFASFRTQHFTSKVERNASSMITGCRLERTTAEHRATDILVYCVY